MMDFKIEHDIDTLRAKLNRIDKEKWVKATRYAINGAGLAAKEAVQEEIQNKFHWPTPFTLRSLWLSYGGKKNPDTTLMWKPGKVSGNSGGRYLKPHVTGGSRDLKGFEKLLLYKGVLPRGYFMVPTKDAPKDGYGNVPSSYIIRMISYLRAFRDHHQNRNLNPEKAKKKRMQFFVIPVGSSKAGLSPGVYERLAMYGGAIRKVFNFTTTANYSQKFDFYGVADRAAKEAFPHKLDEAIKKALDGEKGW